MTVIGRHVSKLLGYAPAVPTPFDDDGNVDVAAIERFCHRRIQEGATALVVCGTTGEAPTLSPVEHRALIRIAVGVAPRTDSSDRGSRLEFDRPRHRIEQGRRSARRRCHPVRRAVGLYAHFHAVAQSSGLPIILYDVPSRSACGLTDETVVRLAEMSQFIGLKDATGDVTRPAR